MLQEGSPLLVPSRGSCLILRSTYWCKRIYCKGGGSGGEQQGKREPLCYVAHMLRVYGNRVSFWVVSSQSSCLTHVWWLRVLSGGQASLRQGSSDKDSGRLVIFSLFWPLLNSHRLVLQDILCAVMSSLLSAPPEFSQLLFLRQYHILYWDLLLWHSSRQLVIILLGQGSSLIVSPLCDTTNWF